MSSEAATVTEGAARGLADRTVDARHGYRAKRVKTYNQQTGETTGEATTADVANNVLKQVGIESDVRADWWAINRKCSRCGGDVCDTTARNAITYGRLPTCRRCQNLIRRTFHPCTRCGSTVDGVRASTQMSRGKPIKCRPCSRSWTCAHRTKLPIDEITSMRRSGLMPVEIADRLDLTRHQVSTILNRYRKMWAPT